MLSYLSVPVLFTAFLGLVSSATASQYTGSDLTRIIQSRQAHVGARSPLRVRELAAAATLSDFQQMESDLNPHTTAILSLCSQLPTASAAKKESIGAQLHNHVSACGQIVSQCGGGGHGGGTTPSRPQPSGTSTSGKGSGGSSSSCSAAAGVYSACVEQVQSCGTALSSILGHIAGYSSSILASYSDLDIELASVLEGAEQSVTGLTARVQTYTQAIRSSASSSEKCSLSTLYSLLK